MGKNLYVGNLSFGVNTAALEKLFSGHGAVESAKVITDAETGRSRGFGFVQMSTQEEAQAAITALDGKEHDGRNLKVNEVKPRSERSQGRGGRGGNRRR